VSVVVGLAAAAADDSVSVVVVGGADGDAVEVAATSERIDAGAAAAEQFLSDRADELAEQAGPADDGVAPAQEGVVYAATVVGSVCAHTR
jgi:hypothetical protein